MAGRALQPRGLTLFDFDVYAQAGDGCMMEGVASEAASYAAHQRLSNLCWIYDSNRVTIEGHTDLAFTEDVAARFTAYGWNVETVPDANDLEAAERAFQAFRAEHERPTLVVVHSHIGYGTPVEDTPKAHGEPLGPEGVKAAKRFFGWPEDAEFLVPDGVVEHFADGIGARGREAREAWEALFEEYRATLPELADEIERMQRRALPDGWDAAIPEFPADAKGIASRDSSGQVLNAVAEQVPWLVGGAADLAPSTKTRLTFDDAGDFSPEDHAGRNFHFGVREFASAAIANGLALSKLRPFWSGFLIFSDYARGAIRLSALMEIPVLHIFTHDSIGVGEDGPTHQPVEQLASLRALPGLLVFRPADANEVAETWRYVMQLRHEPAVLVLSRQALPTIDRSVAATATGVAQGAYVLLDTAGDPDVILIATGSEVTLALDARAELAEEGIGARVVSMPCSELFDRQPAEYRDEVLPPAVKARVAIEQASSLGWHRYVGDGGAIVAMNTFGASAPLKELVVKFGFTPDAVSDVAARSPPMTPLRERPAWAALEHHHARDRDAHLRDLFAEDATRGERLSAEGAGIYLDYSKNRVTDETMGLLLQLAEESGLPERTEAMFRGDRINTTENRSVLHVALRMPKDAHSSSTAVTSSRTSTRCSTAWPRSPSASARASGRAIPASRSATS